MSLTKVTNSMINGASVNVLDFGADPTGITDSTASIQSAIDAAKKSKDFGRGGAPEVVLPYGTYLCNSTLNIDNGNIRLVGNNSTIKYSGVGSAVFIGQASYLTNLTAGYFYAAFENISIECVVPSATCVTNSGYRKIEFRYCYLKGGAVGLDTEGCWGGGLFYKSTCQNQTSYGVTLKQRNNLFTFEKGSILSSSGSGILLSTSGAELKGVKFLGFDFEGCAGAINITGNTGNVMIDGCWFENNNTYNIRIDNTAGTNNKFAITIRNCQITGAGADVLVGTDASGALLSGITISNNEFVDSNLVFVTGSADKMQNISHFDNRYSASASFNVPGTGIVNDSVNLPISRPMPMLSGNTYAPSTASDPKGPQGLIVYDNNYLYIKTAGGWRRVAISTF